MDWHAIGELLKLLLYGFLPWLILHIIVTYVRAAIKSYRSKKQMPIAVVVDNISDKIPLKSLPPDGYVVVRRMNYGESLARSSKATKLLLGSGSNTKDKNEALGEIDIQTEELALWDFANLIVEHNCQDLDGRTLNFKNVADVKKLPSNVGEEIGKAIDEFNEVKDSEEVKNS